MFCDIWYISSYWVDFPPESRYYNTESRQLKFKMARGQILVLEVFRSLISCVFVKKNEPIIFGRLEEMKIQFWTFKKLLEMIKWITFALILFVSCFLGVLGEFLNILLTFWSGRKKSSRLFFDLFFALYFSTYWRYIWRQIYYKSHQYRNKSNLSWPALRRPSCQLLQYQRDT
jgi:hypothetical protein